MSSQMSVAPGWIAGSVSLQSPPPFAQTAGLPTTAIALSQYPSPSSSQPSSVPAAQLSSMPLQRSVAPGWTAGSLSSQSSTVAEVDSGHTAGAFSQTIAASQ